MLLAAAALVLIIGLPTYLVPDRTDLLFSWTVNPPVTAAFLGGAYLTSMVVEYLASREPVWANARIAVPAVLLFTTLTSIVTLRHLDAFHFGGDELLLARAVAWVWLVVYLVVPPLLAYLWFQQSRAPGVDPPQGAAIPLALQVLLGVHASVMTVAGVFLYIAPVRVADLLWPWPLSSLTGGAVGAWLIGIGVGVGHTLLENDLRRVRVWMIAYALFGVVEILAILRLAGDQTESGASVIDWGGPRIWVYLVLLATILLGAVWALAASPRRADSDTPQPTGLGPHP